MATILIVDDQPYIRQYLVNLLGSQDHILLEAADGQQALNIARAQRPDLVISDLLMPTMDGFELVRRMRNDSVLARTEVIFFSGNYTQPKALALAQACGVVHLLHKPSPPDVILSTVRKALQWSSSSLPPSFPPGIAFHTEHLSLLTDTLSQKVAELEAMNRQLAQAYDATLEGWVRALDLRDKETEGHTQRVTEITMRLAQAMGVQGEALLHLRRGALLHDIGKIGVPDHILHKPGPLTDEEWHVMRMHPDYAKSMLGPIDFLKQALEIPYCHHEKWDGTGYPQHLAQEDIPYSARLFAIVDVWDALSSDRPYRPAWAPERIRAHLADQAGKQFDSEILDFFLNLWEIPTKDPEVRY